MKQSFKVITLPWAFSFILIAFTWFMLLFLPLGSLYLLETTQPIYSSKERRHFKKLSLKSEYQKRIEPGVLKWKKDIYILIHGEPNKQDLKTIKQVMFELNALQSQITIHLKKKTSPKINMSFHFQPEKTFKTLDTRYIPTNWGYFILDTSYQDEILKARILISTTGLSQTERDHIIREEFTQSLGLVNDSRRYKDSIFYKRWSNTTHFSTLDKKLIHLLYSPLIQAGDKSKTIDQNIHASNHFVRCISQFKCFKKAKSKRLKK